jgi:hypothetical protein
VTPYTDSHDSPLKSRIGGFSESEAIMERENDRTSRLIASLMLVNAIGLLCVMILVGMAANKDPILADHLIQAMRHSLRMFVAGAFLPILAFALDWFRTDYFSSRTKQFSTWTANLLIVASAVLFLVAGWNLPHSIMRGVVPP